MKKLLLLAVASAVLISTSFGESAGTVAREVMKITSEGKTGADHSWYALAGTMKLTEVQFLEAIGNTEYLEDAKAHETKFRSDSGNSALIFLGSVAVAGTGLVLSLVGTVAIKPDLVLGGAIVGLAAIPGYVWSGISTPKERNLLAADQAQVLAERYNVGN